MTFPSQNAMSTSDNSSPNKAAHQGNSSESVYKIGKLHPRLVLAYARIGITAPES